MYSSNRSYPKAENCNLGFFTPQKVRRDRASACLRPIQAGGRSTPAQLGRRHCRAGEGAPANVQLARCTGRRPPRLAHAPKQGQRQLTQHFQEEDVTILYYTQTHTILNQKLYVGRVDPCYSLGNPAYICRYNKKYKVQMARLNVWQARENVFLFYLWGSAEYRKVALEVCTTKKMGKPWSKATSALYV